MKKTAAHLISILIIMTVTVAGCSPTAHEYFRRGQVAYHEQDYHLAFEYLLRSAKGGDLHAQYAVGYMYYYGIGVTANPVQAAIWFKRAADWGYKPAIAALKMIAAGPPHEVTRNDVRSINQLPGGPIQQYAAPVELNYHANYYPKPQPQVRYTRTQTKPKTYKAKPKTKAKSVKKKTVTKKTTTTASDRPSLKVLQLPTPQ